MDKVTQPKRPMIWDISTRVFHWLLVSLIIFQWVSTELFDDMIEAHMLGGYAVLAVIIFRILWGFFGTKYSRFNNFLYPPSEVQQYAKSITNSSSTAYFGHNPLGGLSVVLMILLISAQAITGLFMTDDILSNAPYYSTVSDELQKTMSSLHHLTFDLLIIVIGMHLVAVVFYQLYKKQKLVQSMVHGRKAADQSADIGSQRVVRAIVIAVIAVALTYLIVEVFPPEAVDYYEY